MLPASFLHESLAKKAQVISLEGENEPQDRMITQIGMVGLGRMGANMVRRILKRQHECVVYDRGAASLKTMEAEGASAASSLEDLVKRLTTPKVVWLMVPAGEGTESITVTALGKRLPRESIDFGHVEQPNSRHAEAGT